MQLLLPKTYVPVNEGDYADIPFYFLAGPVRGGGDWQAEMIEILTALHDGEDFVVVNPCRYPSSHPLYMHRIEGDEDTFERQTDWERHYLGKIADPFFTRGCVIFWLACESKDEPREEDGPYARETYGELGEWRGRLMHDRTLRVVIGAEEGFPGLSQIRRNYGQALDQPSAPFVLHSSMIETAQHAIQRAKRRRL